MEEILVFPAGTGEAILYAEEYLKRRGIPVVDHPTPEVTHLLLDVPTKEIPLQLLERVPERITVVGGNLSHPELDSYRKIDMLHNEEYLANNAAITADCALRVAAANSKSVLSDNSVLVIGWGRIGKCLAALLRAIGCKVTVAARKPADRAMLQALGFDAADLETLEQLNQFSLIFNTAPAPVLDERQLTRCQGTLKIDLASAKGLCGEDVLWARGLPGKYAPESSGKLIADTLIKEVLP